MPNYTALFKTRNTRAAQGILGLKEGLEKSGPPARTINKNLLLATWNIREFDSAKYGARSYESLLYLAEVIDRFDLVAVQEVQEDLKALNALLRYLGGWWKVLLTDVTRGTAGNRERMAFLYDSRKIRFGGLAGEVVFPPAQKRGQPSEPARQLARTPYLAGFQAGWFRFTLCTVHILYGTSAAKDPDRLEEIRSIASFLADRAKDPLAWSRNLILLGDFNIFDTTHETFRAITGAGFIIPDQIQKLPTDIPQTKHYDQIAFIAPALEEQFACPKAGVFNVLQHVYRPEDEALYVPDMGGAYAKTKTDTPRAAPERTRYYRDWRTYQISDHLPMWIELNVDFSREYLKRIIG